MLVVVVVCCDELPGLKAAGKAECGIGRACGGQPMVAEGQGRQRLQYMPSKNRFGHGAVEEHAPDGRMVVKKSGEVVWHDAL